MVTVAEQDVQTCRTCDATLEVTHALPPYPLAKAVTRLTPTMHLACTRWPGQLQGPHPPCTWPAPAGQGSYTAHTHHAHSLRVQPPSAQQAPSLFPGHCQHRGT